MTTSTNATIAERKAKQAARSKAHHERNKDNPEYRAKRAAAAKAHHEANRDNPEYRAKRRHREKARQSTPEHKAKRAELAEATGVRREARVAVRLAEAARLTETGLKRCTKCGETKPLDLFSKNRSMRDGVQLHCKECKHDRKRQYRAEHPEKRLAEERRRRIADPVTYMLSSAKQRAKQQGIPCTVSKDAIGSVPDICPALRVPLVLGVGLPSPLSASLDRRVPALGYVSGNVAVISQRANSLKGAWTAPELYALADKSGDAVTAVELRAVAKWLEEQS
ncbi:hypothetical protein [Bradyrhizobium embrapense]